MQQHILATAATHLCLCVIAAMPVYAQDRIFTDDFETEFINNLIGLEEGFEGSRVVRSCFVHPGAGHFVDEFRSTA